MKPLLPIILLLLFTVNAVAQKVLKDTLTNKEAIAVGEIGGAVSKGINGGGATFGYNIAAEVTPIEDWLEIEVGVSPTYATHVKETDIDLLFKKPWTFSPKVEFMFGVGLAWNHTNNSSVITNAAGGEAALDLMFWFTEKHQLGLYIEPAYEYDFGRSHEPSLGMSGGLLVAIP